MTKSNPKGQPHSDEGDDFDESNVEIPEDEQEGDEQEQDESADDSSDGDEQQADDGASSEDRAKSMGWRPKDQYKGAPGKWVDAEEFLRRTEEDPREVRKANHVLMRKVQKLEQGIESILSHQERQLTAAREQAYNDAHAKLKAAHDEAVASGDVDRADKVWTARETLAKQQVQEAAATPSGNSVPRNSEQDKVVLNTWMQENASWYGSHFDATKDANEYEDFLAKKGVPLADRLEQTSKRIREKFFPEKQRQQRDGSAPAAVRGNNHNGAVRSNRGVKPGSYEALTSAARAECDRSVRQSGGKISKADWLQYATPDMFV